jgi:hypothetical protein
MLTTVKLGLSALSLWSGRRIAWPSVSDGNECTTSPVVLNGNNNEILVVVGSKFGLQCYDLSGAMVSRDIQLIPKNLMISFSSDSCLCFRLGDIRRQTLLITPVPL